MQDSDARQIDRGRRVSELAETLAAAFPDGSHGAASIANIKAALTEAEKQAAKQDDAALDRQESTEQKKAAIKSLLEEMRLINRTARSINNLNPGIADQFRMPRDTEQAILNRARTYINAATPIAAEFTKRGSPDSFLDDLQAAIDAVNAADDRQSAALAAQTAATAGLAAALKRLSAAVLELDAIIRNKFRHDPGTLAAWKSASHLERAPKKAKKPAPPTPPT